MLNPEKLNAGYKKFFELLSACPDNMIMERFDKKTNALKKCDNLEEATKLHAEIVIITYILTQRGLI